MNKKTINLCDTKVKQMKEAQHTGVKILNERKM